MSIDFMDGVERASAHSHGFLLRVNHIGGTLSTQTRTLSQETILKELQRRGLHQTVQKMDTSTGLLQGCRRTCERHHCITYLKTSCAVVLYIPHIAQNSVLNKGDTGASEVSSCMALLPGVGLFVLLVLLLNDIYKLPKQC